MPMTVQYWFFVLIKRHFESTD